MKAQELLSALPDELGRDGYRDSLIKIEYEYGRLSFTYESGYLAIRTYIWYEESQHSNYWSITTDYESLADLCIFSNNPETEITITFDEDKETIVFTGDSKEVIIKSLGERFFDFYSSDFEYSSAFGIERKDWQRFQAAASIAERNDPSTVKFNALLGVNVDRVGTHGALEAICTNICRRSYFTTFKEASTNFTLPVELIDAVAKFKPRHVYLKVNEDKVLVETNNAAIISPLIKGDFPWLFDQIPCSEAESIKVKKQDFVKAIQRASGKVTIKNPDANQVMLILNNGQLTVQGTNGDFPVYTESDDTNDSSICVCAVTLLNLLKYTSNKRKYSHTEKLELQFPQQVYEGLQIYEFGGLSYYFWGVIKTDRALVVNPNEPERKTVYEATPVRRPEDPKLIVEMVEESPLEPHISEDILEKIKAEREEMGIDSYIQLVDEVLATQADALLALKKARTANLSLEQQAELVVAKAQLEETLEISKEVQEAVENGYGYDSCFYEDDLRELAQQLRLKGGRVLEIALNLQKTWRLQLRFE